MLENTANIKSCVNQCSVSFWFPSANTLQIDSVAYLLAGEGHTCAIMLFCFLKNTSKRALGKILLSTVESCHDLQPGKKRNHI